MFMAEKLKHSVQAKVTGIQHFENGWFAIDFQSPEIAEAAMPGGFVQVRVAHGHDPLLRRPLSIAGADQTGRVALLVRAIGAATKLLSEKQEGDVLEVIGPLGNGFPEPEPGTGVWLVAGGCGLAPFLFMLSRWNREQMTLFYGAGMADDCIPLSLAPSGTNPDSIVVTTEDGSRGARGLVTDTLQQRLEQAEATPDDIYTCGPPPMMKRVAEIAAQHDIACLASLEAYMGCGFGACMGCAVSGAGGGYLHVCTDGPVFGAEEIDWTKF